MISCPLKVAAIADFHFPSVPVKLFASTSRDHSLSTYMYIHIRIHIVYNLDHPILNGTAGKPW